MTKKPSTTTGTAGTAKTKTGATTTTTPVATQAASTEPTAAAQTSAAIASINPSIVGTPANWDSINESFCDLTRGAKFTVGAAIRAGRELLAAQQELGAGFEEFINTRTPWTMIEARTMIAFAAEAGLQPEQLTPAVAVPLSRVLKAVVLLGRLYAAEAGQINDNE